MGRMLLSKFARAASILGLKTFGEIVAVRKAARLSNVLDAFVVV